MLGGLYGGQAVRHDRLSFISVWGMPEKPEKIVVPAQAGAQASFYGVLTVTLPWPPFVKDSPISRRGEFLDSRLRGNDG